MTRTLTGVAAIAAWWAAAITYGAELYVSPQGNDANPGTMSGLSRRSIEHGIHAGMSHGPVCGEDFAWRTPGDEPQANEISNCYIHHNGQMDWGSYGIFSSYCRGNRVAHNLVEQQPYSGICACFTWFAFPSGRDEEVTVEHNHIHHVMLKLFDGGAIYTKDGVAKTSVLRGNLLHDIGGGSTMNNGIFLDDRSYGFHLADNIIYGVAMPVRFNGTSKEKFTWGTNYFGVKDFPRELAEKAGLQEPYRGLLLKTRGAAS